LLSLVLLLLNWTFVGSFFTLFSESGSFYGKREFDSLRHLSIRINVAGNSLSKHNFSNDGLSLDGTYKCSGV
jgi:hypothetical protein